jgi:hypothetical protein
MSCSLFIKAWFNPLSLLQYHYHPSFNSPNISDFTCSDVLNIPHISVTDVTRTISRLRSTKCVGPDEIPNFIIKGCSEVLTPLLHHIFNLSLLTRSFPRLWKQAAVVPIFKKGNSALVTNYRPISFANLCHYRFLQFVIPRNYDLILNCLNFRTLYSRRHLDALFLINIFKSKINCHSIMDTVGIRVPTRQIRDFSTFSISSGLRHSPSVRCASAANETCRLLDIFGKDTVSFEDTFCARESD